MNPIRRVARIPPRSRPLGPMLRDLWAVDEQVPAGSIFPARPLRMLTLQLTESGQTTLQAGDQTYKHSRQTLVAMPSGIRFSERVEGNRPWCVRYLMMRGPLASHFQNTLFGQNKRPLCFTPATRTSQQHLDTAINLVFEQPPNWPWQLLSALSLLMGDLFQSAQQQTQSQSLEQQAIALVNQSPYKPWSVPRLARALGMNENTLWKQFKQQTRQTPARWIRGRRIQFAQQLLTQGLTVTQVADRMQYSSPYHFSRQFTMVTGYNPSQINKTQKTPLRE